jgi:putative transposase
MEDFSSLKHTRWECKYHVVFIPKCRRKVLYGQVRQHLGKLFHELAGQRESKILEGHLCVDHVHMLVRIPPKHSVSYVVGYVKGKSAIRVARDSMVRWRQFDGQSKCLGLWCNYVRW